MRCTIRPRTIGTKAKDYFGVEKQIKGLFGKTVTIRNGAYLIIEHTKQDESKYHIHG